MQEYVKFWYFLEFSYNLVAISKIFMPSVWDMDLHVYFLLIVGFHCLCFYLFLDFLSGRSIMLVHADVKVQVKVGNSS